MFGAQEGSLGIAKKDDRNHQKEKTMEEGIDVHKKAHANLYAQMQNQK